ncbi:hypothetical protein NMG60_11022579 [Bertholletia excelsa]
MLVLLGLIQCILAFWKYRSRRKKNASVGENFESTTLGQGTGEGKKALYHCNYCNKDITGKIRIKCATCPDFDLCVECFSVGAEVTPHKSDHSYRVMDNLSFPLICPDWNADEEILLLEGIEMYGMGNWAEIAEHVGTKSKEQCIHHYNDAYMNSPYFPLPDMTHVVGKNREELLAMAKGEGEDKKGNVIGELNLKEESSFSPSRMKIKELHKNGSSGQLLSGMNAASQTIGLNVVYELQAYSNYTNIAGTKGIEKASNVALVKIAPNLLNWKFLQCISELLADHVSDRSFGGKKPKSLEDEGPSLMELSSYNPKRQEFDVEYDNDAEQLLAEMEFKDKDTEVERELKLRVLRIYAKRLDERKRRKDFILERNLLHPNPFEKDLSPEEKAICRRFDVFMRLHSKEEHEELLKCIIEQHRILKKIHALKEARAAGCRTTREANRYLELKQKRESEEIACINRASSHNGPSSQGSKNVPASSESIGKDSNLRITGQANPALLADLDIMAFPGADLLSESEKRLCREIKLTAPDYLKMQEILTVQIMRGGITKKSDAYPFLKIEPSKVDRIYDILVKKGIAQP